MNSPMAFRATYADWKLIKTRGVVQVVMEVPLADSDAAYDVLGGMPNSAHENWFAIAPLTIPPAAKEKSPDSVSVKPLPESDKPTAGAKREKMDWRDVQPAAQAGIRCDDPMFQAFLREQHHQAYVTTSEQAAEYVRGFCVIKSRSELSTDHRKRVLWHQLDSEFLAWKAVEHA